MTTEKTRLTGAKLAAAALGLEVVYDGQAQIVRGQDLSPIASAIVASDADIVFITTNFDLLAEIYGGASGFRIRRPQVDRRRADLQPGCIGCAFC